MAKKAIAARVGDSFPNPSPCGAHSFGGRLEFVTAYSILALIRAWMEK